MMIPLEDIYVKEEDTEKELMNMNNNNYFDSFDMNNVLISSRVTRINRHKLTRYSKV